MHHPILQSVALVALMTALAHASGTGSVPPDSVDKLGESIGGIGSAIEICADGGVAMLSDRGPGDGRVDYRPRLELFSMTTADGRLEFSLEKTLLLRDPKGDAYTGLFPNPGPTNIPIHQDGRECIDPEGLAVAADGRFFISEEYGPAVLEFSASGRCLRRFETPAECVPRGPDGVDYGAAEVEMLNSGREPNRGFEGLALMPGGKTLAAILQSGLVQDGGRKAGAARLYLFDITTGRATAAYAVPFADLKELNATAPAGKTIKAKHLAFSSLAALPDGRLLALERENFGADGSRKPDAVRYKAIVVLDMVGADDILGKELAAAKVPVARSTLFNLAEGGLAASGMSRDELPAKWEGLALQEVDGRHIRLLLGSDNDFLNPVLKLERDGLQSVSFPKATRSQATRIIGLELPFPPRGGKSDTITTDL